jgi:hypothetical protein
LLLKINKFKIDHPSRLSQFVVAGVPILGNINNKPVQSMQVRVQRNKLAPLASKNIHNVDNNQNIANNGNNQAARAELFNSS